MRLRSIGISACLVLSLITIGYVGGADTTNEPTITGISPNPTSQENLGEYVLISFSDEVDLSQWTLTDGRFTATFPNQTVSGTVAVTKHPRVTELLTDHAIVQIDGYLPLAADGDTITLHRPDGSVVDEVTYGRTSNGEKWRRGPDGTLERTVPGVELQSFESHSDVDATAFVLPDAPEQVVEMLRDAEDRLWLAGYELTDSSVTDILLDRYHAGVDVRVVIDGRPVGGQHESEQQILSQLRERGIPVYVLLGERRRFQHYHPKYAIVDETAIVMSENWKPAGTGGESSRGWGIVISDSRVAADLSDVFIADSTWRDRVSWDRMAPDHETRELNATVPLPIDNHAPQSLVVDSLELVVAPEGAYERIEDLIRNAEHHIDIQQVRIGDPEFPLLSAVIEAAERGVSVRIQLDSTWYVAEENAHMVAYLESLAADRRLDIEVRKTPERGDRYEKIHNKGMIVDQETVVIGSLNWNNVSMYQNREVLIFASGTEIATYYHNVFEDDWVSPEAGTPIGFVIFVVGIWIGAGILAYRRLSFVEA